MRNTKSNATLPATSNTTYMTKLYPQELSTYLENEYDKCPHIRKSSKPHGFVYLMICNTNKCKIGITKDLSLTFLQSVLYELFCLFWI